MRIAGWPAFIIASAYLIGSFLWRFFAPAHEYPMSTELWLDMILDAAMLLGLVGSGWQLLSGQEKDPSRRLTAFILLVVAGLAGIGLFGVRLTSEDAWWTGHRLYWLEPRDD